MACSFPRLLTHGHTLSPTQMVMDKIQKTLEADVAARTDRADKADASKTAAKSTLDQGVATHTAVKTTGDQRLVEAGETKKAALSAALAAQKATEDAATTAFQTAEVAARKALTAATGVCVDVDVQKAALVTLDTATVTQIDSLTSKLNLCRNAAPPPLQDSTSFLEVADCDEMGAQVAQLTQSMHSAPVRWLEVAEKVWSVGPRGGGVDRRDTGWAAASLHSFARLARRHCHTHAPLARQHLHSCARFLEPVGSLIHRTSFTCYF